MMTRLRHLVFTGFLLVSVTGTLVAEESLTSDDQQRFADGLYARGMYEMALSEYRNFLAEHPAAETRSLALYRAGECARQLGQTGAALELYRKSVAEGQGRSSERIAVQRARLRLSDQYLRSESYDQAIAQAEALLASNPDADLAAPSLYQLGQAAYRAGDAGRGRKAFDQLIQTYPEDVFAVYAALALARQNVKDTDTRKGWYRLALRNPPSADVEVEALWGLASIEMEQGRLDTAAEQFKRIWLRHPDSARVRAGMLHIAWSLFQAGRYAEALDVAKDTSDTRKAPQADTWLYLEAVSLRMTGETDQAVVAFQRLLKEFPDSRLRATASYDLALLYTRLNRPEDVLPLAEDLMSLSDRREDGLWLLAESARAGKRTGDALKWYGTLIQEFPQGMRTADAVYNRGVLLQADQPVEAAQAFAEFARRYPQDPRAATALRTAGSLNAAAGDAEAALTLWQNLLEKHGDDPRAPEVRYQTALLALRAGKQSVAKQQLTLYVQQKPVPDNVGDAAYWLAIILENEGQSDQAEMTLRQALTQGVSTELEAKARLRLGLLLQRANRPSEALEAMLPLLTPKGADGAELSDALRVWMLQQAKVENKPGVIRQVAATMVQEDRGPLTREMGYYALANTSSSPDEAIRNYRAGLALESESEDAAEAAQQLGDLYFEQKDLVSAEAVLKEAVKLSSTLERGDLQVRAMKRLGDLRMVQEKWEEAARLYMGVAVLYDEPSLTPASLAAAANAFERAGLSREASQARKELKERYPDFTPEQSDERPAP